VGSRPASPGFAEPRGDTVKPAPAALVGSFTRTAIKGSYNVRVKAVGIEPRSGISRLSPNTTKGDPWRNFAPPRPAYPVTSHGAFLQRRLQHGRNQVI
jgi:hypothetical protein